MEIHRVLRKSDQGAMTVFLGAPEKIKRSGWLERSAVVSGGDFNEIMADTEKK